MLVELREKMRDGEGTVQIKNLFQPGDLKGKTRLVAEITIPVGGSIGYHQHDLEEEIFYFLRGRGRVKDHDQWKEVNVGDALVTGGGKGHAVENIGNEPLVLMAVIIVY
jgi:mannose-6-phosphate isomerase-like protein (cupin superfamily)